MSNITREQQNQSQPLDSVALNTPVEPSAALNEANISTDATPEKSLLQKEVASLIGTNNHKHDNNARAQDMRQEEVLNANEANLLAQSQRSTASNNNQGTNQKSQNTSGTTTPFKGNTRTTSESVTNKADIDFEIEAEKRRVMLANNTVEKDPEKHLRPGENIALGLNDDNRGNSGFKAPKDKEQSNAQAGITTDKNNSQDIQTRAGVSTNLELAKATLSTLAQTHVKDEVYRENAQKREEEFNQTLKELSSTYSLSEGDKRGLNSFYFSEYQRESSARTQTIQGISFQLEEAAKAHAGDAKIRSLNGDERAASVNRLLDRINKETPLSAKEREQLVSLYNGSFDKHNNGAASKENKLVEKIVKELTPFIKRDAATPTGQLKTEEVLKSAFLKYAGALNPALEDAVRSLYESKLNDARSREYTLATQKLAAKQAGLDLTSREQLTSEGQKLKNQFSDVTISEKQKNEIFQKAYDARKEAIGGQPGFFDNLKSGFTSFTNTLQQVPVVGLVVPITGAAVSIVAAPYKVAVDLGKTGWTAGGDLINIATGKGSMQDLTSNFQKNVDATTATFRETPVLGFVSGMAFSVADSLGLTNVAQGAWDVVTTPFKFVANAGKTVWQFGGDVFNAATGKGSWGDIGTNLWNNIGESGKILVDGAKGVGNITWGVVKAVGEVTGVTDVLMAGKYALEGNWAMAGVHLGFAALSLGATGGLAAPSIAGVQAIKQSGKVIVKTAVKEFVQEAGEQIGKEFIEQVGEVAFKEAFEKLGKESAEQGIKEVGRVLVEDSGAKLTKELVQEVQEKVAKEQTEKTLKEMGLRKFIDNKVFDLHSLASDPQALAKALKDSGVTNAATRKKIVREVTSVMNSEVADDAVKEILEKSISKPIQEAATEAAEKQFKSAYKESLERIAKGQTKNAGDEAIEKGLKENAELLGKNVDEVVDDLTEAAWKGQKEGMEKTIKKVVREGIDDAYKRIRDKDSDNGGDFGEEEDDLNRGKTIVAAEAAKEFGRTALAEEAPKKQEDASERRTHTEVDGNGNSILVTEIFDPETQRWERLSATTAQKNEEGKV
jgi:hypothetical protein